MDFSLTEEQRLIQESVAKFVSQDYDFAQRCAIRESAQGFSREHWQAFAELGWLGIPFSEEQGGFGGGPIEVVTVMEELGKGLVLEPYLSSVLLAGRLIAAAGNAAMQERWLDNIIAGQALGAFAYLERQSRFELSDVLTSATKDGDSFVLNGQKTLVFNGPAANVLLVSARSGGDQYDSRGLSLFCVDPALEGIHQQAFELMDGQRVANIRFDNVRVGADCLLGDEGQAYELIDPVVRLAMVGLAAEAVGIIDRLVHDTVEYSKTRKQFGSPIGSFQALQHRMVEMFINHQQAKSIMLRAALALAEGADNAAAEVYGMKALIGKYAARVGEEAIQLHGGMGITDELAIGHYVKRLMVINNCFGNVDYCQQRFCDLSYTLAED